MILGHIKSPSRICSVVMYITHVRYFLLPVRSFGRDTDGSLFSSLECSNRYSVVGDVGLWNRRSLKKPNVHLTCSYRYSLEREVK
jgi:hypothetical protein